MTIQSSNISKASSKSFLTSLTGAALIVAMSLALSGCGGPKSGAEGDYKSCVPSELKYSPRDNGVYLQWRPNCGSAGAERGYNFYIVPDSEVTANFPNDVTQSHNGPPYPGDTKADQSIETVELHSLLNGVAYSAFVRNVKNDGTESKPSNVIHFTPMPSGKVTLNIRYKGDSDGYEFSNGTVRRADNAKNDLYFSSSAKGDFLGSPSKLSFGLKSTRFRKVGNFDSMFDAAGVKSSGSKSDDIKVKVGDVIEALTENNHYVRIRIQGFAGSGAEKTVEFEYLFQTTADLNLF